MSRIFDHWLEDNEGLYASHSTPPTIPLIDFSKHVKKKAPKLDLNPSSADRWTTCTASASYIFDNWDLVPPQQDTVFNTEGTTAHEVASALLQGRKPNEKDKFACPVPVNKEMRRHGWAYMEYVEGLKDSPDSKILVEQKLPLWYMPGRNAIVDAAVINPESLHVIDYKYGAGIIVSTEENKQATIYAYSIGKPLNLTDTHPVFVHIYQPRGRAAEDSPFHVWETTWGAIWRLAVSIELASMYILRPVNSHKLVFAPSDKACQWCPAKGFCTARSLDLAKEFNQLSEINDKVSTLPAPKTITLQQLGSILTYGDLVIDWIKDAKEYALEVMKHGVKIPGHKLVTSRGGHRFWTNPNAAAKELLKSTILNEDEVFEKKLIGPAAVEKLLGKNKFSTALTNLIGKPPGQPVIAPEADKRKSCLIDGTSEFENLDTTSSKTSLDQF